MPWITRAAKRLLKVFARPHHMLVNVDRSSEMSKMGRRPNVLARGTQRMLLQPIKRTLTATRCVSLLNGSGVGGPRSWKTKNSGMKAGNAGATAADPKLATKEKRDIVRRTAYLRHVGHWIRQHDSLMLWDVARRSLTFRGSNPLCDGGGISWMRSSCWLRPETVRCSSCSTSRTVPGGSASATCCFDSEKA